MEQGTSYLYEYNNGRPVRCAGFIHVTEYFHSCILQLRATQIPAADDDRFDLSAFRLTEDRIVVSRISTVACRRSELTARLSVPDRMFPEGCTLAELSGFLICRPEDSPAASALPVFWVAADPLPPADIFMPAAASAEDSANSPSSPADTDPPVKEPEPAPPSQEAGRTTPSSSSPAREPDPPADLGSAEKKSEIQARKIKRSDLTLLPRRFWPLANNSFLLHGYRNYGHLLLLEDDGRLWLGVPGIYDPREARAADLFGFPHFTQDGVSALDLSENECSTNVNFGHWCRCVR